MPKISIPKELEERMDRFSGVDWSSVIAEAINRKLDALELYSEIKRSRKDRKFEF